MYCNAALTNRTSDVQLVYSGAGPRPVAGGHDCRWQIARVHVSVCGAVRMVHRPIVTTGDDTNGGDVNALAYVFLNLRDHFVVGVEKAIQLDSCLGATGGRFNLDA